MSSASSAIAPGSIPAFPRLRRYYATLLRRPAFVEAVFDNELRHQGLLGSSAAGAAGRRKNGGGGGGAGAGAFAFAGPADESSEEPELRDASPMGHVLLPEAAGEEQVD